MRLAAITLVVLLGACDASHLRNPDAAPDADAAADAFVDARDPCSVAGLQRCDAACGRNMIFCADLSADPEAFECLDGLCMPSDPGSTVTVNNGCSAHGECGDDRVCVIDRAFGAGICMPELFCDEAAADGFPVPCIWSDESPRVTGPPHDASQCPAGAASGSRFCGGPCASDCSAYTAVFHDTRLHSDANNRGVCIGRSDERQFGICGPDAGCSRGTFSPSDRCTDVLTPELPQIYPELGTQPCVCIVFRGASSADGLSDFGYINSEAACRRYRDLYPEAIDCIVDSDWHTLP